MLLVRPNTLPNDVKMLLRELRPTRATVFGGSAVVSDDVFTELGDFVPEVSRTFGDNRYGTGAAVSSSFDPADTEVVVIATGADFPDALAGVPVAAAAGGPVLLVAPDQVPDVVAAELDRLGPRWIVVLGGAGAISDDVFDALSPFVVAPG